MNNLILLGFSAAQDPPRKDARIMNDQFLVLPLLLINDALVLIRDEILNKTFIFDVRMRKFENQAGLWD